MPTKINDDNMGWIKSLLLYHILSLGQVMIRITDWLMPLAQSGAVTGVNGEMNYQSSQDFLLFTQEFVATSIANDWNLLILYLYDPVSIHLSIPVTLSVNLHDLAHSLCASMSRCTTDTKGGLLLQYTYFGYSFFFVLIW